MRNISGLTHEEIAIACRNVGINLECGGCAENFYTGYNNPLHHNQKCTKGYTLYTSTDNYTPPNYENFFNFIESENGAKLLTLAERGELSFKSTFDSLRAANALPEDSAKRIWAIILSLFYERDCISMRSWNAFLRDRGLKINV